MQKLLIKLFVDYWESLNEALTSASQHDDITDQGKVIILQAKQSSLFNERYEQAQKRI